MSQERCNFHFPRLWPTSKPLPKYSNTHWNHQVADKWFGVYRVWKLNVDNGVEPLVQWFKTIHTSSSYEFKFQHLPINKKYKIKS